MNKVTNGLWLLVVLLFVLSGFNYCLDNTNFIKLDIDNVSFDENSFMTISDNTNGIIAYYDRFENKSYDVKSARVYDKNNKLKYTLVPILEADSILVHVKNDKNQRGLIKIVPKVNIGSILFDTSVDFFQLPFKLEKIMNMGIGEVKNIYNLKYEEKIVLTSSMKMKIGSEIEYNGINVDKSLLDKPDELACWSIVLLLLNDVDKNSRNK